MFACVLRRLGIVRHSMFLSWLDGAVSRVAIFMSGPPDNAQRVVASNMMLVL